MTKLVRQFDTVLIANRGEIAMRVQRTARRLGLRTVVVYSEADRDMAYVRAADEALCIGPAPARESYLDVDAILAAARRSGAEAIHPGYGFLSENADFAARVEAAGLVFVGPSAAAIDAMGNKARAKGIMEQAGVPVVPGFRGTEASEAAFLDGANAIGYPVMVKAAAGGGGRGMRLVHSEAELRSALASARSEAQAAFGSGELLLERAILRPRHIEIQVLADAHGNVVHLGERDCSVQRRHQKVIEETPSPAVGAALRARMTETAITAARAIGYIGAGTLEFLLDEGGRYYFMEMNTRLQVEHAVTEMVTGLDLVEWQFRVAAGEPLGFSQGDIAFEGHAIEVRLCAEAPEAGFLPQSGPVVAWVAPDRDCDVRVDHCLRSGADISPHYDSMIAKIVAHGRDRNEAVRKLAGALERTILLGTPCNQSFLLDCVRHPEFRSGATHTGFIAEHFPRPAARPMPPEFIAAVLVAVSETSSRHGLRDQAPASVTVMAAGETIAGKVRRVGACAEVMFTAGGSSRTVVVEHLRIVDEAPPVRSVVCEVEGRTVAIGFVDTGEAILVAAAGRNWTLARPNPLARRARISNGAIVAPLSGRVVGVAAELGAEARAGDVLVVIEAMKMEHRLCAGVDGIIAAIDVKVGDQTRVGQVLARVAVAADGAAAGGGHG
ncbi:MAG: acetyl-CoA carboxylase biotin carboxylase subunit [Xanthobacteraceae bacterium]|nr:acetyl-CoA carboxylase biotin carboxylase subunit [Xanthobacteraceae bacterium]